jgi:hypothetical protein
MRDLIHWVLVYFGIRKCCDNQKIVANRDSVYYYEYECKNCGYIKAGSNMREF